MFLEYRCIGLFFYNDILLRLKIVYTKMFVIVFSDLGFYFFRIKNIRLCSKNSGLYMVVFDYPNLGCVCKLFRSFLLNCCWGCFCFFFLAGIGFRVIVENLQYFLRLGYSNLILLHIPVGILFVFIDKMRFCLYSLNLNLLMKYCMFLRTLHYNNVYKQKGLYFKNEILNFKILRNKKVFF